uniref:outer membrane protein assembly factor BamE n=1 Tax=Thaumasiovibrio occultus TaxID=1891184 RepID=UPI000B35883D|nr:outer membrane protein assembly factor BamE [Thaumasiovibrio occultus]
MTMKKFVLVAMVMGLLSGCSLAERLVYRIDINQGNYLVKEDVEKLRFGMNFEQVSYVLGSPMLVESHDPLTWYYVHYLKPGHDPAEQQNLIVEFDDKGLLANFSGDFTPTEAFYKPLR